MSSEGIFNGAKTGFTCMYAYIGTVAEELGMEKALDLDNKACQMLGAAQGKMIKEQVGNEEIDSRGAAELLGKLIEEGFGILSEVTEESPQKTVRKLGRCPIYEGAQAIGFDNQAIEATCRAGSLQFMDAAAKQLNPKLSYQLTKFRSSADDSCEETVVLEQ